MSAAQVDAVAAGYGDVTARMDDTIPDDVLRDTLEKFGDGLSDAEKQELIAAYADAAVATDGMVTETRGEPGLVLRYQHDRLVEIMPAIGQRPLLIAGTDLFSLDGLQALILLERSNGGPGRYAATEAAFDGLAISTDGFCVTDPAGVRVLDGSDERFRHRTVILRPAPYRPESEMLRYLTHRFLEQIRLG
ncbi:hypothetical protein [Mycolicibacterium bacteremicum]|uniref:hypothetical protein n=1 Tax=Mycolicibacterium bacteremicum TaxID=564198 RepID=UPI0026F2FA4E|nr:hypothetical protein [Mycolicibacterium bacteremicum]